MIAATNKHQMCTERRGGGNPVAASRARHAPAARKAQDTRRITPLRRVGSQTSVAPMTRGFIVVPPFTRPGLRARPFSHSIAGFGFLSRCQLSADSLRRSPLFSFHAGRSRGVKFCGRLIARRTQVVRIELKPAKHNADPFHPVQSFALGHEQTCRAKEFRIVRTAFQGDGIVF